jgi:hypothetical protein
MAYNLFGRIEDNYCYWISELCPLSGVLKGKKTYRNSILLGAPTQLVAIES